MECPTTRKNPRQPAPLRRFELCRSCARRVAPTTADSHEDSLPLGVLMSGRPARYSGFPSRPAAFERFGPTSADLPPTTVPPVACATRFILPRASRPLQSTATCSLPSPTTRPEPDVPARAPPLEFRALFATSTGGIHTRAGSPIPTLRSVLGVSHARDGFRHHRPCGFVAPRSHVQGSPYRGLSPTAEQDRISPARLPSCR